MSSIDWFLVRRAQLWENQRRSQITATIKNRNFKRHLFMAPTDGAIMTYLSTVFIVYYLLCVTSKVSCISAWHDLHILWGWGSEDWDIGGRGAKILLKDDYIFFLDTKAFPLQTSDRFCHIVHIHVLWSKACCYGDEEVSPLWNKDTIILLIPG